MNITIIGCGNMGLVYARSFLKYDIVSKQNLLLVEKSEPRKCELEALSIGRVVIPTDPAISESDIIILAIKPQDFKGLAGDLRKVIKPKNIVLSIMAGITIEFIQETLKHTTVVRAMPNSPVELGMGITGFTCEHSHVTPEQLRKVENLLATTGRSVFFEKEDMIDAVTALSGSGPAYFFYLVKAMIEAGKQMGMEEPVAAMLVKQTMLGSFHLINNATRSLDELIKVVASKGGTTEAAFNVFNEKHVGENLAEGIKRAEQRAKELSKMVSSL